MRIQLSEEEVADYRANGFLVVEELLTAPELAQWRDAVDTVIAQDLVKPPTDSAAGKARVFDQRMNLRRASAAMKPLVQDRSIGKLIAQLEGVDAVRVYLDQALVKEPYGAPTQFHQDLPWWPFDSNNAATIWIALDDATVQNGCLYFVPGSHHLDVTYKSDLGSQLGAIFDANPQITRAPVPGAIPAGGMHVSQRPDDPWGRRQHDGGPPAGDDGGVHAGRRTVQRHPGRQGSRCGIPRHPRRW